MTIRASSAAAVERLVAQLRDGSASDRAAAIARLRIIGTRALSRLSAVALDDTASPHARVAALQTLEDLDDERARDIALAAAASLEPSITAAALAVLHPWIRRDAGALVDALTTLALDEQRPEASRAAILDVLAELHGSVVTPLQARLQTSDGQSAAGLPFPGEIDAAREWLQDREDVPLPVLHDFIVYARQQEHVADDPAVRSGWKAVRGLSHSRLAARGSTVALYDLREAFEESTEPLPLDFLGAIGAIGDTSCLEPMAKAWAAAPAETWWRDRLSQVAADVMKRTRLSAKSAAVRRLRAKYPGFVR